MNIDTRADEYPIVTSLKFRLLLSLIGKGALIQHKGKLYNAIAFPFGNGCKTCCFHRTSFCSEHKLYDMCCNIEDAYGKIYGERVSVVFKKYVGKLPPDNLVVVF